MKALLTFSFFALLFLSCRKDRTCTCTYANGNLYSETKYTSVTKKEAKAACVTSAQNVTCVVK